MSIPDENIFIIPVNLSPAKAAESYQQSIISFFKNEHPSFDIILLGMGEDGHTASIFPESPILNNDNFLVCNVYVEKLNSYRVTMTSYLINNAKNKLFLISGEKKVEMFKKVTKGKYDPEKYPAQIIKNADWYIST